MYEMYERVIEMLRVKFNGVKHLQVLKPVTIPDYKSVDNKLILVRRGQLTFGNEKEQIVLKPGDMLFLPEGVPTPIKYGKKKGVAIKNDKFSSHQDRYLEFIDHPREATDQEMISYVSFNVRIHDAIDFFNFLDIGPFPIQNHPKLAGVVDTMTTEDITRRTGAEQVLHSKATHLFILIMRYILEKALFIETIVLKVGILTDVRLVSLFKYIVNNISGNLSNEELAKQIGVSKDYVGQYFKNATKFNLQSYIELIRLNKAIELLRTTNMKVYDISKACGYQDIAYFCRKFKILWGNTTKKVRRRNLINK